MNRLGLIVIMCTRLSVSLPRASNPDPHIMQNKLRQAQSELATLKEQEEAEENSDIPTSSHDESVNVAEEKRKTEERLKRLIRRCELYIKRHQMLKEMGTNM